MTATPGDPPSNKELAAINKELAAINKELAAINKELAAINKELAAIKEPTAINKELQEFKALMEGSSPEDRLAIIKMALELRKQHYSYQAHVTAIKWTASTGAGMTVAGVGMTAAGVVIRLKYEFIEISIPLILLVAGATIVCFIALGMMSAVKKPVIDTEVK